MGCCLGQDARTLKVRLSFRRAELLYDIRNCAYVESHVMAADTEHARHMVADVGEEGNVDRVTRTMDLSVSMCRELLYPWAKRDITKAELDDRLEERDEYVIEMAVAATVSQTTLTLVERLVHEYVVCRGVADWLSITNAAKSEAWLAKAAEAESELRTAMQSRMGRTRTRQHFLD